MSEITAPNGQAPQGDRFRMGVRGGRTGQAWQYIWDRLDRPTYRDGTELAREAATAFDLKETSILTHLRLALREGYLASENRDVLVPVTKNGVTSDCRRVRTFYRIGHRG